MYCSICDGFVVIGSFSYPCLGSGGYLDARENVDVVKIIWTVVMNRKKGPRMSKMACLRFRMANSRSPSSLSNL